MSKKLVYLDDGGMDMTPNMWKILMEIVQDPPPGLHNISVCSFGPHTSVLDDILGCTSDKNSCIISSMDQPEIAQILNQMNCFRTAWLESRINDREYINSVFWMIAKAHGLQSTEMDLTPPPGPLERKRK